MKSYQVQFTVMGNFELTIKANSEADAIAIAQETWFSRVDLSDPGMLTIDNTGMSADELEGEA